jgi:hypothetical protein
MALVGSDTLDWFVQSTNVARADSGELSSGWSVDVDDPAPGNPLGESASRLFLDLHPRGV